MTISIFFFLPSQIFFILYIYCDNLYKILNYFTYLAPSFQIIIMVKLYSQLENGLALILVKN